VSTSSKISITLPEALLSTIRKRVRDGNLSRYISDALEDSERRRALRAWLTDQETEYGPIPEQVLRDVRRQWLGQNTAE